MSLISTCMLLLFSVTSLTKHLIKYMYTLYGATTHESPNMNDFSGITELLLIKNILIFIDPENVSFHLNLGSFELGRVCDSVLLFS